jgi:serine protease AprX
VKLRLFLTMVFTFLILSVVFAQSTDKIGPVLQHEIENAATNSTIKIWVYFTDKPADATAKSQALAGLSKRSLQRRAKVMDGDLIDQYDMPLNRQYVEMLKQAGAEIVVESKWLNAVSARITTDMIGSLAQFPFVAKLEKVIGYKRNQPQSANIANSLEPIAGQTKLEYGSSYTQNSQINVPVVHDMGINGSGVLICMLDNNFPLLNHVAFSSMNIVDTWDFINNDSSVDDPGEGTHGNNTLSTVGGYSPGNLIGPAYGASFMLGKTEVEASETQIEEDYWVAGSEWADEAGADIISSSLGYLDWYTWASMDGQTAVTTLGAAIAIRHGVLCVNSAGNEGSGDGTHNTLVAPADGDSVIAVGAVDGSGNRVYFSSVGPTADGRIKPDVAAMGSGVTVSSASNPTGFTTSSGTSFSCPLTSGVAALVLSANPSLTPMQVRDALRNTASQANNPDNLLGWGILDAQAAVFYYTPKIEHEPLPDTEETSSEYTVNVQIESQFPVDPASVTLHWGNDAAMSNTVAMTAVTGGEFSAVISGNGVSQEYFYYVSAANDQGITATLPFDAPGSWFRFYAGPDTVAPQIAHTQLRNQSLQRWPAVVTATVSDNLGIDSAWVEYRVNNGELSTFLLAGVNETYSGTFPVDGATLVAGDLFEYRILATDASSQSNGAVLPEQGYLQFEMLDVLGTILVMDDDAAAKIEKEGKPLYERKTEKVGASADRFRRALEAIGYLVDEVSASGADPNGFDGYDLLISSSGGSTSPVGSETYRAALMEWVLSSGNNKLIIEGGEIGYDALSSPGYADFAAATLHGVDWDSDDAGALQLRAEATYHPIATLPNQLPASISINYSGWGDEDAVAPASDALVVYGTNSYATDAGVLVYDDNANPKSAQIVFLAFNLEAIADTVVANMMAENIVTYLMRSETTPTGTDEHAAIPVQFRVDPNYPNPFNPETNIRFVLPQASRVKLEVINLLGQRVLNFDLGVQKTGTGMFKLRNINLASGIYFYRLKATAIGSGQTFQAIHKMIYRK